MSDWKDFVTNAVLGVRRGTPLDLPDEVADTLDAGLLARQGRERRFLTRAGAFAAWRRANERPPISGAAGPPPALAEAEEVDGTMGPASVSHLRDMLGGRHELLLPEWLDEASRLHRLAPPESLPALLDYAKRRREWRPLALAVGGRRAAWLAGHNPAWNFAADASPEHWEDGTVNARLAVFRVWREDDPALALEKLTAAWKGLAPEARAALVEAMEVNLADADAPFLETLLDDRNKDVRKTAAHLLLFLAASPLVARMTRRAGALLQFKKGHLLRRSTISVMLPDETDSNGARDGLDTRAFGLQIKLGAREILLIQILAAVPLEHWTETYQLSPLALLKAVDKDPYKAAVATGWAMSALRERNSEWAEILLNGPVKTRPEVLPPDALVPLLPEPLRVKRLLPSIRASLISGTGEPSLPPEILAVRNAFPEGYLPEGLTRELLDALRRVATVGTPWHQRAEIEGLLARVPPGLLAEAAGNWPMDRDGVECFVDLLTFRREALAALSTI